MHVMKPILSPVDSFEFEPKVFPEYSRTVKKYETRSNILAGWSFSLDFCNKKAENIDKTTFLTHLSDATEHQEPSISVPNIEEDKEAKNDTHHNCCQNKMFKFTCSKECRNYVLKTEIRGEIASFNSF